VRQPLRKIRLSVKKDAEGPSRVKLQQILTSAVSNRRQYDNYQPRRTPHERPHEPINQHPVPIARTRDEDGRTGLLKGQFGFPRARNESAGKTTRGVLERRAVLEQRS
jgi:hypothetical protein